MILSSDRDVSVDTMACHCLLLFLSRTKTILDSTLLPSLSVPIPTITEDKILAIPLLFLKEEYRDLRFVLES